MAGMGAVTQCHSSRGSTGSALTGVFVGSCAFDCRNCVEIWGLGGKFVRIPLSSYP